MAEIFEIASLVKQLAEFNFIIKMKWSRSKHLINLLLNNIYLIPYELLVNKKCNVSYINRLTKYNVTKITDNLQYNNGQNSKGQIKFEIP